MKVPKDPVKLQSDHCAEKLQKSEVFLYYSYKVAACNKFFSLPLPNKLFVLREI